MKHGFFVLTAAALLSLSACKKQGDTTETDAAPTAAETTTSAPTAAAPAAPVAEPGAEDQARAEQQAKLDYATMEDGYINDAKGQWATSAKASSSFGEENAKGDPNYPNQPTHVIGAPDGQTWSNKNQDIGFDWLEASYAKPVSATEVRVVTSNDEAVESISKIELIDEQGTAHAIWSGLSDTKPDARGDRTWFVRKLEPTAYLVRSVKVTLANNVATGYKEIDAVQLVGN